MPYRPHGRASVNSASPRAWATCDRCGLNYNLEDLKWQFQWIGAQLQNLNWLVCDTCLDKPAEFLKSIILPPDPVPVSNPRPENYNADFNNAMATQDGTPFVTEADNGTFMIPDNSVNDADEDAP